MNDENSLFVGVPSTWRDDLESRVAAVANDSEGDPFVRFIWQHFASFNEMLGRFWIKESAASRARFFERVLARASADFGNPQTIPGREAFPLEWFTLQIARARYR
jgi:hypothetical protein